MSVNCSLASLTDSSCSIPSSPDDIEQDPKYRAIATNRKPIGIPKCAATISRAFRTDTNNDSPSTKKRKGKLLTEDGLEIVSEEEDIEDIQFLLSDDEKCGSSQADFDIMSVLQTIVLRIVVLKIIVDHPCTRSRKLQ